MCCDLDVKKWGLPLKEIECGKGVIEGGENQGIDVTKKLWVAWRGRVVAVKKIYFNML